ALASRHGHYEESRRAVTAVSPEVEDLEPGLVRRLTWQREVVAEPRGQLRRRVAPEDEEDCPHHQHPASVADHPVRESSERRVGCWCVNVAHIIRLRTTRCRTIPTRIV